MAEKFQNADIFGGDSDLSDLEDEAPQLQQQEVAQEAELDDMQDVHHSLSSLKIRKKVHDRDDYTEGPKRKRRKPQRKQDDDVVENLEPEETPEQAKRRELNRKLDALLKKPKQVSRKKRKGDEDLDAMNDEMVITLRNAMDQAATADITNNEKGMFAVDKLRMLPFVVDTLQKTSLAETIVENGLLDVIKRWLEPLPDASLPAVAIQRDLLFNLKTLPIETSALKSSGLGKIVYFYTKTKRVDASITRLASQLVSDWMRPIIRRSKALADKEAALSDDEEDRMFAQLAKVQTALRSTNEQIARRHARIPDALTTSYKIAPGVQPGQRRNMANSMMGQSRGSKGGTTKMKEFKKKIVAKQVAKRKD